MSPAPQPPEEPPSTERAPLPAAATWLVDGYNVLHTVLLGGRDRTQWWREECRREVTLRAARLEDEGALVVVVFDGDLPGSDDAPDSNRLRVVFAPSADDWLVAAVRAAERPEEIGVVTADRKVAGRCRHKGAHVVHPRDFLAWCPSPTEPGAQD